MAADEAVGSIDGDITDSATHGRAIGQRLVFGRDLQCLWRNGELGQACSAVGALEDDECLGTAGICVVLILHGIVRSKGHRRAALAYGDDRLLRRAVVGLRVDGIDGDARVGVLGQDGQRAGLVADVVVGRHVRVASSHPGLSCRDGSGVGARSGQVGRGGEGGTFQRVSADEAFGSDVAATRLDVVAPEDSLVLGGHRDRSTVDGDRLADGSLIVALQRQRGRGLASVDVVAPLHHVVGALSERRAVGVLHRQRSGLRLPVIGQRGDGAHGDIVVLFGVGIVLHRTADGEGAHLQVAHCVVGRRGFHPHLVGAQRRRRHLRAVAILIVDGIVLGGHRPVVIDHSGRTHAEGTAGIALLHAGEGDDSIDQWQLRHGDITGNVAHGIVVVDRCLGGEGDGIGACVSSLHVGGGDGRRGGDDTGVLVLALGKVGVAIGRHGALVAIDHIVAVGRHRQRTLGDGQRMGIGGQAAGDAERRGLLRQIDAHGIGARMDGGRQGLGVRRAAGTLVPHLVGLA